MEGKIINFIFDDNIVREGTMVEDKTFWGGYKIICDNMVLSLNSVTIIEDNNQQTTQHDNS